MADFQSVTTGKLNLKDSAFKGNGVVDAASNGPGNVGWPKGSDSVGATGDNAANNGPGNKSPSATTKVGATGDGAAKRGTGA
jgi:hypothetical protein